MLNLETGPDGKYKTQIVHKVFNTDSYHLRLMKDEVETQTGKDMPHFQFMVGDGSVKDLPNLLWGDVNNCFQTYVVAVIQVLWKLCMLYEHNNYSEYVMANSLKTSNDKVWGNTTALPHQQPQADKL